jgi:hypothetical protein
MLPFVAVARTSDSIALHSINGQFGLRLLPLSAMPIAARLAISWR